MAVSNHVIGKMIWQGLTNRLDTQLAKGGDQILRYVVVMASLQQEEHKSLKGTVYSPWVCLAFKTNQCEP